MVLVTLDEEAFYMNIHYWSQISLGIRNAEDKVYSLLILGCKS